jgi:LDH2 family malate/lactate/ureidoglycolate dehydrogenase
MVMNLLEGERVHLSVDEARALSERALQRIGYDAEEARIVAAHVLDAALCGYEYSGLPKILNVAEHRRLRQPRRAMRAVRETPVSAMYDGGNNVGMVTMYHATQSAIAKAREHGFAVVGVNNSWVSGRGAHYVEMIADAGLIGLHTVSSTRHVAPPGGAEATFGTNPIACAFPTAGEAFVIDMGTSAFMSTDLLFRQRRGELLPEGVAIDADGKPTRDPASALQGAILPFGGYKGFALALMMQGFGVLAGSGSDIEKSYGYLVIAIKPDLLMSLEDYRRDMSATLAEIKATPRLPGIDEIRLPSERAFAERARNRREGIVIDRHIYDALNNLPQGRLPEKA